MTFYFKVSMSSSEGSSCSSESISDCSSPPRPGTIAPYQFEPQLNDAEEDDVFNPVDEERVVSISEL